MPRRILLAALAVPLACGPSLARLERGHHYDEAIAGATEGALPKDQVAAVVRRALDPALHVAAVPRAQVAALLADGAPELERHAIVRVVHDSNTIPLKGFRMDVRLRSGGAAVPDARADLEQLAAVFREPLPGPRTVEPDAIDRGVVAAGNAVRVAGAIGAVILHVSTIGLSSLFFGKGAMDPKLRTAESRTVYPTEAQLRAAAPRAAALADGVAHLHGACPSAPGSRCTELRVVGELSQGAGDLALEISLSYSHGALHETYVLPLPPGDTLEDRLAALFGGRMRRLAELPLRPG